MLDDYEDYVHLRLFRLMVQPFMGFNPNTLSLFSFAFALLTGATIALELLPVAMLALLLSMFFDGIDGYVARQQNKTSELGFLTDHVLDRLSDIVIFVGVGAAYGNWLPALLAVIVAVFSSYVGVLGRIYHLKQDKAGLFNRTNRIYMLLFTLLGMSLWSSEAQAIINGYLLLAIVTGSLTSANRLRRLFAAVARLGKDAPVDTAAP
ncbi:MAG: CDP-alcohol phosphatidyltransferase family protein [Sedimenticola sp.]